MYTNTNFGGEGATALPFQPTTGSAIGLVAWPIVAPGGNPLDAAQELYRLAYEWAQAVLRPGRYERACRVVAN
jgi:hypothetical protein